MNLMVETFSWYNNIKNIFLWKHFQKSKYLNELLMHCDASMNAVDSVEWIMTSFWLRYDCIIGNESECIQNESNESTTFDSFDSFLNAFWRQLECSWLVWLVFECILTTFGMQLTRFECKVNALWLSYDSLYFTSVLLVIFDPRLAIY